MSIAKDIPIYRIALLGVAKVGKTQILNQFVNHCFNEDYETTFDDYRPYKRLLNLGTEKNPMYCLLIIEDIFPISHPMIENGGPHHPIKMMYTEILDNQGKKGIDKEEKKQSRINVQKQIYGYLFVFDVTKTGNDNLLQLKQLENVIRFIENAEARGANGDFQTMKMIVGNKKESVTENDLAAIKQNPILNGLNLPIHFVSAKYNEGITSLFSDLCKRIQEDPKILTLEEEWVKEKKEESKEEEKPSASIGFKKSGQKKQTYDDDNEEENENYGDRILLEDDFLNYPKYEPQGIDAKSCSIY